MNDLLRQRLQPGDKVKINERANNKAIHGKVGEFVRYTDLAVRIDGEIHLLVPTSLDVIKD